MIHIEESIIIPVSQNHVYSLLKNMGSFSRFIYDIKKIKCKKIEKNKIISDWNIIIDGAMIMWREEDIYHDDSGTIDFRMIEGDYTGYEGSWRTVGMPKATKLIFSVHIDYGAPALVKFVEPILTKKTKRSIKSMLIAIKRKLVKK
jgi:ribosome-associated toxin RatA of RatAB toxin-antitoxin module